MMPTRGRDPFRAVLLGSVTPNFHNCPIWTAAHVETLSQGRHIDGRNVVCAVDLSPKSSSLIQTAQDLNRPVGAAIRIAHAVPGEEAFLQRLWNAEFENSLKQRAAKTVQDIRFGAGTSFEVSIETGEVSCAIASCA